VHVCTFPGDLTQSLGEAGAIDEVQRRNLDVQHLRHRLELVELGGVVGAYASFA